jgi:SsrA-binding protein
MSSTIQNRKAYHDYAILDTMEAGLVLLGSEVKSIREGQANLKDSFARIEHDEVILYHFHISPYDKASHFNHNPLRPKKLLLHRKEIRKLAGRVQEKGLTLIALKVYFVRGRAKVELGLGRGKKLYDKRDAIAKKDSDREIARALKKNQRNEAG